MGLFNKKEKKIVDSGIPTLPRLPKLPDLPDIEEFQEKPIHQLPSFPSNSLGTKFSQNTIKDAISGEIRGDEEFYADDFSDDEMTMMQRPLKKPITKEMEEEFQERPNRQIRTSFKEEAEPIFVRIDKFEEGLKLFENIKNQISTIEKMLTETKRIKEKEDAELHDWENELKRMREKIEKIGSTIFSKI